MKFTSLPVDETYCWLYYGNPSATSASSGSDTFLFFDDFNTYATGALAGQGGWTGVPWLTVQEAVKREGAKAIFGQSGLDEYVGHSIPEQTYLYLSHWMRLEGYGSSVARLNRADNRYCRWSIFSSVNIPEPKPVIRYYDNGVELDALAVKYSRWYRFDVYLHGSLYDLYIYDENRVLLWSRKDLALSSGTTGSTRFEFGGAPHNTGGAYYDQVVMSRYDVPVVPVGEVYFHYSQDAGLTLSTTSFTYDGYNKLTEITHPDGGTEVLTYDGNGQLTKREKYYGGILSETTTYSWDDRGLLVQVVLPSGEPVRYTYDGAGRLIGRKDADGEQSFVQSGWDIVQETDEVSKQTTYYTGASALRDDGSLANGSSALYYHYDHLGNTRLVTDEKGEVVSRFHYEAYGKTVDGEGQEIDGRTLAMQPYLYVSKYGIRYDSKTEMHYMRHRWYQEEHKRFISTDKILGINRYSYANSNPVKYIDPSGLRIILPPQKYVEEHRAMKDALAFMKQYGPRRLQIMLRDLEETNTNIYLGFDDLRHPEDEGIQTNGITNLYYNSLTKLHYMRININYFPMNCNQFISTSPLYKIWLALKLSHEFYHAWVNLRDLQNRKNNNYHLFEYLGNDIYLIGQENDLIDEANAFAMATYFYTYIKANYYNASEIWNYADDFESNFSRRIFGSNLVKNDDMIFSSIKNEIRGIFWNHAERYYPQLEEEHPGGAFFPGSSEKL